MIIKGINFFKENNNKTYKIVIVKDKETTNEMIKYFEKFNSLDTERYIGIDFEFNRSLDNTMREIALFQINLETNEDKGYIYMFYPPDLTDLQINILKQLLLNNKIKKIIHGGESLDIPYLFKNLFTTMKEQRTFCINLYDSKYLCEYYNLEKNLIENRCKIYYLLKQMKVVSNQQFKYLLDNEEKMGPIYNIRIKVDSMSEALINYCAYDVLYLPQLYKQFPKEVTYQKILPELTCIHFILKQTDFFNKYFKKVSEYNNYFTVNDKASKKNMIDYYNETYQLVNEKYPHILKITYFKKFFEIIFKYIVYYIVMSNIQVYINKETKLNKKLKPPNKIIKKIKNFKHIVVMIENIINLTKKNLL